MLKVIKGILQMQAFSLSNKKKNRTIGFVPTMGYLHEGHLSLVRQARKDNNIVVVSIFINPAQFGPKEDLKKYPKDLKRDRAALKAEGVDVIFYPDAKQIYPKDYSTYVNENRLSNGLCGASRHGHFRGVTTILAKLFNIVQPNKAYFGKKDYQQQAVIKKMVKDLHIPIKIISLETVREKDGLAMSSRNIYLDPSNRKKAATLRRSLLLAKELVRSGIKGSAKIRSAIERAIKTKPGFKIDYIEIVDADTLEPIKTISGRTLIALAVFIGGTRLIDNIEI